MTNEDLVVTFKCFRILFCPKSEIVLDNAMFPEQENNLMFDRGLSSFRMANTLGTRGFSRVRREFLVLAEGEAARKKLFARVTIKTWPKPETALEKSLAPRVDAQLFVSRTWFEFGLTPIYKCTYAEPDAKFLCDNFSELTHFSKIQLVVYYQRCVLIGWATTRLYVIAHY